MRERGQAQGRVCSAGGLVAAKARRTISTFSCDIARAVSRRIRGQTAKYYAASSSMVPLVRTVVEPSSFSIALEPSPESLMPPLGSQ